MTINDTIKQLEKDWGKGAIMRLGDKPMDIECIPTGSMALDMAIGGGIPRGLITEIYGPESSGKTTVAISACAQAQRLGLTVGYIDAEHAFDPNWAAKNGVNPEEMLFSQPSCAEEGFSIAEALAASGDVSLIILDSIPALVPKAELEGEVGQAHVGLHPRIVSQAMKMLVGVCRRTNCAIIAINQLRFKIGVMFGNPETTPGGMCLKHAAACRIDVRRAAQLKKGDEVIGQRTKCRIAKNKIAPAWRTAEFDILYSCGIDILADLLDTATEKGALSKAGAWYKLDDEKLANGREATLEFLRSRPDLVKEIDKRCRELV